MKAGKCANAPLQMAKLSALLALLTAGTIGLSAYIVAKGGGPYPASQDDSRPTQADGRAAGHVTRPADPKANVAAPALPPDAKVVAPDAGPPPAPELTLGDAGAALPEESGQGLPEGAPKSVTFGVVLVSYRGAQGAPQGTRSKEQALALAKELAELAKTDFKAAVAKGDEGSTTDAGRIPRGILEPAVEVALFSLDKNAVSDPIDTPRGFWIAQRIE